MKQTLNTIKQWVILGFTALIIFCWWSYIFLKARQSNNPLLTDTTPWALYVNQNETLTAAKWNTLVAKCSGVNIKIYTWTTAVASSTTFAHWLNRAKIVSVFCMATSSNNTTFNAMSWQMYQSATYNRLTTFDTSNIIINHYPETWWQNQPYRCVVMYTD